jgi:hypothetical protein
VPEGFKRIRWPFNLNEDSLTVISDMTGQTITHGKRINIRAKTDSLYNACNCQAFSSERGIGRGISHGI